MKRSEESNPAGPKNNSAGHLLHRITTLSLFAIVISFTQQVIAESTPRPNVILILTDDQGSVDMNCYGAKDLVTPNMDALAARGVRFTQFYSGAPVCSPSRAACLTGRNPHRAGMSTNAGSGGGMPVEQITIAEILKPLGYATAHIGKWHLGHRYELFTSPTMGTRSRSVRTTAAEAAGRIGAISSRFSRAGFGSRP